MENLLQQIADNTTPKSSSSIIVSGSESRFTTRFNPPIQLNETKSYEMGLQNLDTYYSFPNIDETNNLFKYEASRGIHQFRLPVGSYTLSEINDAVQKGLKENGHENLITLSANTVTLKTILKIISEKSVAIRVDFTPNNSIGKTLGFNRQKYTRDYQESENVVDILKVNTVMVESDIISGSYVDGTTKPVIYSFFPNVDPGHKIVEKPNHPVYLPVTMRTIDSITTTLTDQDGNELNTRGERITIRYHIKEV